MADTSLIFSIIARDRTSTVLNGLKRRAESTGAAVAKALGGPAILPVLATAGAGIASMGVALASAGAAAGVFGKVAGSAMAEVTEEATKVTALQDKMELLAKKASMAKNAEDAAKFTKQAAAAQEEMNAQLAMLDPATRGAVQSQLKLKGTWQAFVDSNKPAVFGLMQRGYGLLGSSIGKLQPLFDIGQRAAGRLLNVLTRTVNGGFIERMTARAGPALDSLTSIIINVGSALGRMFGRTAGDGQNMLRWIENMTAKWATWAAATDGTGFDKFLDYANQHGPTVVSMLGNLAAAAVHIAQAVAPLAPISMAVASALAAIIAAIPPPVLTALVGGWLAFNVAMRLYALGSGIATAAQWAMNSALLASPITWIVAGIALVAAGIYLLATKTKFFQTIWSAVWGFMKSVGAWFAGPFANFFVSMWAKITASLSRAKSQFMSVVNFIKNLFIGWLNLHVSIATKIIAGFTRVINFVRSAPGKMAGALRNMFAPLWNGFRGFVNRIISGWNNLSFGIPGFSFAGVSVPGINVGTPNIPYLASGGDVRKEGLAYLHRGERVAKAAVVTRTGGGTGTRESGGGATIRIEGSNSRVVRVLLELLREGIRDQGGDPVKVLTAK